MRKDLPYWIDVIGVGRMGAALCAWLAPGITRRRTRQAGRNPRLDTLVSRRLTRARRLARLHGARRGAALANYQSRAEIVLLSVPDDALEKVVADLAGSETDWRGRVALHTSGALDASALAPLAERGAAVGSLHPLMTFAAATRRDNRVPAAEGLLFTMEGDTRARAAGRRLIRFWGGQPLTLAAGQKPLYHLAAMFASPFLVVNFALAEDCLQRAGLTAAQRRIARAGLYLLLRQTARNLALSSAAAWTGPLARGDLATLQRHLAAAPELAAVYGALAEQAFRLLPRTTPSRKNGNP